MNKYKLFNILFVVLMAMSLIAGASIQAADKVNINQAAVEELATLKKIGPAIAERIVQYREEHGDFTKIEDIMNVKGIGQKTFDLIKDTISIE